MPRTKMPERQAEIYEELVERAGGARMLSLRQIAQYWGRDDRAARKWARDMGLPYFELNGIKRYKAMDVARAVYISEA